MRWQDRSVQFEGAVPFGGNLIFSINNATKPLQGPLKNLVSKKMVREESGGYEVEHAEK